jgi:enamine deaminase RidA (YjgF/YER057c/UK114 family)
MPCGFRRETRAALKNVKVRLALAGAAMAEAVKTSARLCDRDGFPVTDAAHAACSLHRPPARSSAAEAWLMLGLGIAVGVAAIAYAPC